MMGRPHIGYFGLSAIGMVLFLFLVPCLLTACGRTSPSTWLEEARVTSPDGQFDAVITEETTGPVLGGGVYWHVFIIPRGGAAPKDDKNSLLSASVLRGEKLVWKQNHLLEVHYDLAEIEEFQNVWGSYVLQGRGWRPGDYMAELRLAPSSSDFSFLTPDGDFKRKE
jgi:hypothetical protein